MVRPFRFSVQAFTPKSATEWTEQARAAEDLGYDCFHLADHYLGPGEAATAASHPPQVVAAIPAMAAAAAVTSTIKVGARVMCCDYHQPVVLAKSLATIDFLSEGRLEAGFGAGWIASEYDAMGVDMDRAGIRIDRMVEYVELAKAYFAGADLDRHGEHVQVSDMAGLPASPQPGGPKIMIGGGSPRVLGIAGAMADIVSINFDNSAGKIGAHGIGSGTADGTAQKVQWIKDGAGDRFDDIEIEIGAYFTNVTDDTVGTLEMMSGAMGMPPEVLAVHPHALVGSVDEICDTLQARRDQYGISYINVAVRNMTAFAPVVDRLAGN